MIFMTNVCPQTVTFLDKISVSFQHVNSMFYISLTIHRTKKYVHPLSCYCFCTTFCLRRWRYKSFACFNLSMFTLLKAECKPNVSFKFNRLRILDKHDYNITGAVASLAARVYIP